MKALPRFVIFLLLLNEIHNAFSEIEMFDDKLFKMQESLSQCILTIVNNNFRRGSIIGIATAGLKQTTNKKLAINTNNMIVEKLMNELKWNVLIKTARTYQTDEMVRL